PPPDSGTTALSNHRTRGASWLWHSTYVLVPPWLTLNLVFSGCDCYATIFSSTYCQPRRDCHPHRKNPTQFGDLVSGHLLRCRPRCRPCSVRRSSDAAGRNIGRILPRPPEGGASCR